MIPTVNPNEVSQDIIGVYTVILASIQQFGNATVAFFLEQVPERGEALWLRFKEYRDQEEGCDFMSFVRSIVTANPLKVFYPRECTLDTTTQGMLVSLIQPALAGVVKTNDDVLKIYFGEGEPYRVARNVTCKGCPIRTCRHWVNMNGKRVASF